jgi:[protein-PII] uridylyltransferase
MSSFEDILARAYIAEDPFERFPALRKELDARRDEIRALAEAGASGRRVVRRLTRLTDELLTALYLDAAGRHIGGRRPGHSPGLALVAVGGYGRAELNPHSDIDLLFLHDPARRPDATPVVNEVLYPLWDLRFAVGHAVRTLADCLEMGQADLSVRTAMMESRLLAGDEALYRRFARDFGQKVVRRDVASFLYQKAEEQRIRHERYGSTVFLQQPNVKESPGALRDIQYLIWIAIARYGVGDLKGLEERDLIATPDYQALVKAQGFIWRIRNALHFSHGKRVDILTFEDQLALSERFGMADTARSRGVERFMRRYYQYASRVLDVTSRFVDRATARPRSRSLSTMLFSRRVAPYFILTSREIRVDPAREDAFLADGKGVVNLFHLAQVYGLRIHHETVEWLTHASLSGRALRSRAACEVFLNILRWDSGMAETLQRMHRLRVLGRILPEFARVDRLVTFSQYHKYTVDAHTLHAMEIMEALRKEDDLYGRVYRSIRRKDILHLAMLLHDAGKGMERDHCEVGEDLARSVSARLGLSERDSEMLVFLVRDHLTMSHIAFRRDVSDDKVLTRFARDIESPERLKMLFVLTHVDIKAVGPGTWNRWKDGLLTDLYLRSLEVLSGRRFVMDMEKTVQAVREQVAARFPQEDGPWLAGLLDRLPGRYLVAYPVEEIEAHVNMVRKLKDRVAQVAITPHEHGNADITVCAHDSLVPGLFSRIAGTLSAKEIQVLDARIATFRDDVILDVFRVKDPMGGDFIDHNRWERIRLALLEVLEGGVAVESLFAGGRGRQSHEGVPFSDTGPLGRIDNDTSDSFTVIDVFAADRQGLLYMITRELAELELSIFFSRIATKADRVVDVFYVKNAKGAKVTDPEEMERVRGRIMQVLTEHEGVEA